jgi:Methyltransferase domain
MASIPSRIHDRVPSGRLLPIGRRSLPKPRDRFDQLGAGRATRSDVYARPDIYDMEYEGAGNHDARFFARLLARVRPRRVLELACGSGRVTFTLAAALPMADIVGMDSSIDMLGKAATAFRLLRPGGVFILDVRVPDLATLAEAQRVRPRAFVDLDIGATRRTVGEEARLLRCTATTYEPHLQRADVRLLYDRFDQRALAERLVTDFTSHIYFPSELELLFLSTGFEITHQYGDYRFVPFDRPSL